MFSEGEVVFNAFKSLPRSGSESLLLSQGTSKDTGVEGR